MNVALHCPEHRKILMTEFLANRGIFVSDEEEPVLVFEEEYETEAKPDATVSLGYRADRLRDFDDCLRDLAAHALAETTSPQQRELNKSIIMGKRGDCFEVVRLDDVRAFESIGDDTFCLVESGRLGVKPRLYELERAYADKGFIRIGKPYVVNISHIAEVVPWFNGKILLRMEGMKDTLEVSRAYARQFREFLGMA
jgi:DNA-binding LytR/AlgR family response regulator